MGIEAESIEISLRYDGFHICWGTLAGRVVPQLTTWEISKVRRTPSSMPKGSNIKCPAFYNPCLRIVLHKASPSEQLWGHAFKDKQTPDFEPPKEREPWMKRVQRALVLSPAAP